ncbi:MAG: putative LPS assembly protein LptD [Flavobacteriales bacterium]
MSQNYFPAVVSTRLKPAIFTALVLIMAAGNYAQSTADTLLTNADTTASIVQDDLGLDYVIDYYGKDSTVVDVLNERILLYGDAWVTYGSMEVHAAFIEFSFNDFTAKASGLRDSTGHVVGKATFKDGDKQFDEDSLAYNFKTKRGISYGVRTKEDQLYLLSEVSKKAANNWISIGNGQLTTCDHENPHFHFRLKRAMVIPNEKVVSGPVVLKFRKVPLFALPFGFFPNKRESTHGILLPGYGNAQSKGYFLQNLGYYVPFSPGLDGKITFDIYTRGSWAVRNAYSYKNNYRYSGNLALSYQSNKTGLRELPGFQEARTFNIQWSHTQDPRARPNTSFNSSVNFGSMDNFRQNINVSQQDFLTNTFSSTMNWSKRWPDKPFNIGMVARHTQNTNTKLVEVTLPQFTANMTRITLGRFVKNDPGWKTFLDNFGLDASMNAENRVSEQEGLYRWDKADSLWQRSRNGLRTGANLSTSVRAKQFGTLSFNLRGESFHTAKYLQQSFDEAEQLLLRDTLYGFKSGMNWSASANYNFRLYGTFNFGNRKLKAIRHMVQPRAGISYNPYSNYTTTYFSQSGSALTYSPFDLSAYKPAQSAQGMNLNLGIQQNFEAKVRDKSTAKVTYKKVKLIDSWNTTLSRNFMADSLQWSSVNMNAFTTIAQNVQVNYSNSFSLYDRDTTGRVVNQYLWDTEGKLMRMTTSALAINFDIKSKNKKPLDRADSELSEAEEEYVNENRNSLVDFSMPFAFRVNYNLGIDRKFNAIQQRDTLAITNRIGFSGDVTFLKIFALSAQSGYDMSNARYKTLQWKDFGARDFITTTLGLHIDLHCWEFSANFIPFGDRRSWTIQLNIKSPLLKDLKLQRRGTFGEDIGILR